MKRLMLLFLIIFGLFVIAFVWNSERVSAQCCYNSIDCPSGFECRGAEPPGFCNADECCDGVGWCVPVEYCCLGPGCDLYCDQPGCDPNNECNNCGDGNIDPLEQCDEGDSNNGDGCDFACLIEACGNGVTQSTEHCDDGGRCDADGDGFGDPNGQFCLVNDLNYICPSGIECLPVSGDGCDAFCVLEDTSWCGNGVHEPNGPDGIPGTGDDEECDDGNPNDNDTCDTFCKSVEPSCEDNQVILRLEKLTNSHGEDWVGNGGYPIRICYDEIFDAPYNPTGNPGDNQVCVGNNVVLRLNLDSGESNGHAEEPYPGNPGAGYSNICFGELECVVSTENCIEGVNGREVLSLEDLTNSHLEERTEDTGIYNYRICCQPLGGGGGFLDLQWQDYAGNKIGWNAGIGSFVNRTVKLYADTTFEDGADIVFEIWENDPRTDENLDMDINDDKIRTIETDNELTAFVENGVAVADWKITDADMERGGDGFPFNEQRPWEFYFHASAQNSDGISDVLDVENFEGPNTNPRANITAPVHRQTYYTGVDIEFSHDSFDIEGPIEETHWTIEQNDEIYESTEDSFSIKFGVDFGGIGQATVNLRVVDTGGNENEDEVAILLVDSPGMLAYVNKPFHHEVVVADELLVMFSGSDSYVVNSNDELDGNGCPVSVDCVAGNCPHQTKNVPGTCTDGRINFTINNPNQGFDGLEFDWSFDDSPNFHYPENQWSGFSEGEKAYPIGSSDFNDKWIKLDLMHDGTSLFEDTERIFTILDETRCLGGRWFIKVENGLVIDQQYTFNENNACRGVDESSGTADDCCPGLYVCGDYNNDEQDSCYLPDGLDPPTTCSDYETKLDCEKDEYGLGDLTDGEPNDPNSQYCGTNGCLINQCDDGCVWENPYENEEERNYESCYFKIDTIDQCNDNCEEGSCFYESKVLEECTNGWMKIEVTSNWVEGSNCSDEEFCEPGGIRQIPCGQLTFDLSFFEIKQGVAAFFIIAMIYFFILKSRKEE